ncbi:glycine betaine/L-proline ABC transporter ATP-binding protein [Nodularia harveyana UHCC-0300]|uniref:Glycine betaine/L-proline ABC transporter ATP-binding protein n=1 Tax=Nodularia harveyana UHCC-0300 TaxID=2974287 RepID=A0ABU5UIG1_9CYAN|nr:glycine betaine/L-proline ABC transporter ATP-binding protein [Nodularia harveyana]MEA5583357.1 glycine betaine/L-proline ABC transporter ATP-binding protein [Nodularia harveyana UHCC-0300]
MKHPESKIVIEHLIKIYGEKPHAALKLFRSGGTRDSILEATGNVLGIADVSLTINEGELFVVMGLSGSGKSTLVRCINRLINPTSGHIYIDGEDIAHVDEKRMRSIRLTKVSMVFQGFGLFPHKTVAENVEYGLKVKGMDQVKRRKKALETLESVGLAQWGDYLPSSLSGGMQQRVGLARALATDADILLMDEAFSALDPLIRREMQGELLRLQKELHKTIVFISHDIQEALKIGDRIAVMKDGAIVQIGTPEEIITQPANEYIRTFTKDVNRAQVLTIGSIVDKTIPFIFSQDSPNVALEKMSHHLLQDICVVDNHGKPVGILNKQSLESALQHEKLDITEVMQIDFPQVKANTIIENTFPLYEQGLPVAVVDNQGKFQGILGLTDALASISNTNE